MVSDKLIEASIDSVPSINIFGSCVSREPFNHAGPHVYNLKEYVHKVSPLFIHKTGENQWITESEVDLPHNFVKRSICTLLNGTARERLLGNKGEWIIVDTFYFISELFEITTRDESGAVIDRYILQLPHECIDEVTRIVNSNEKYRGSSIRRIDASPNYSKIVPEFADFLKNWNSNVIVISASNEYYQQTGEGFVVNANIIEKNRKQFIALEHLIKSIDCWVIPVPLNTYSIDDSPVHYDVEVEKYVEQMIHSIVSGALDWKKMTKSWAALQRYSYGVMASEFTSTAQLLSDTKAILDSKNEARYPAAISLCKEGMTRGHPEFHALMGHINLNGWGVKRNNERALEHFRYAFDNGVPTLSYLIDVLLRINTEASREELSKLISENVNIKDRDALCRIGRLYADGIVSSRDVGKAVSYYRRAIERGNDFARIELFDLMFKTDQSKYASELHNVIEPLVDQGSAIAQLRLARLYRDGVGVGRDPSAACDLFKKAADGGVDSARMEWFRTIWSMNDPKADLQLVPIIQPLADSGNDNALVLLGRAYRDGRGIPQDYDRAISLIRSAYSIDGRWGVELFDVLWKSDSSDYQEMKSIVERLSEGGNPAAKERLARLYYRGWGVAKDIQRAIKLLIDAAESNDRWSVIELYNIYHEERMYSSCIELEPKLIQLSDAGYAPAKACLDRMHKDPVLLDLGLMTYNRCPRAGVGSSCNPTAT